MASNCPSHTFKSIDHISLGQRALIAQFMRTHGELSESTERSPHIVPDMLDDAINISFSAIACTSD